MVFDQGQPLGRQNDRKLTVLNAYRLRRREIRRTPKCLNLSSRGISRFAHGCIGAEEGSMRRIETIDRGAMISPRAVYGKDDSFVLAGRSWQE